MTGEQILVDTSDPAFRQRYRELVAGADDEMHAEFARNRIREVALLTDEPYDIPLKRFFPGLRRGGLAMSGFYEPLWLLALLVIPVLAGIYYYVIRKKKQEAIAFSRIAFVKSALGDAQKSKRTHLLFIIALAAIGLLVVALADPHIPLEQTKEGVNVILVIDDSGSMQATDYQPTRLEAAKSAAELLVGNLDPKDSPVSFSLNPARRRWRT